MKRKISKGILMLMTASVFVACKEDPAPYFYTNQNGWVYSGGEAEVNQDDDVEIDFDIEDNLNVDGVATISDEVSIENDLNLNDGGKVIIETDNSSDTIFINGNMNVNDTIHILTGVVVLDGNMNVNANGIVNISDSASVHVLEDVNHSGVIYGEDNLQVDGTFHKNGSSETFAESLNNN